ncbi:MAG: response regulator [Gemmatimonadaceae bacterium]|nr:response regulator [Gemmatimonadaceae bacterium]
MAAAASLRIVVADDERPARSFLLSLLRSYDDVTVVGEAASGDDAVQVIERERPDLALLDLQMPELGGLDVVRAIKRELLPLIAFVTAYDEFAVQAFELNAVDYLLKPVDPARLRRTIDRAHERLDRADARAADAAAVTRAAGQAEAAMAAAGGGWLKRIPVRKKDDVLILPVDRIAAIEAEGETLHITTHQLEKHTVHLPLRDLEARLDPQRFLRLSRSTLVRLDAITKVSPGSGGTFVVTLSNGQQLGVSRIRSRALRDTLLKL